jgi:hypothetical protein
MGGAAAVADVDHPHLTVSQVLGAHAAAEMAAAAESDRAHHNNGRLETTLPIKSSSIGFTISWGDTGMCIGFKKPSPPA